MRVVYLEGLEGIFFRYCRVEERRLREGLRLFKIKRSLGEHWSKRPLDLTVTSSLPSVLRSLAVIQR